MNSDVASATAGRRRLVVVFAAIVLVAAVVVGAVRQRSDDDAARADLTIGWGGSEGRPSCVYDPKDHTVAAKILVSGHASTDHTVTVTVTAYADENTTQPVGSTSRRIRVHGDMHSRLVLTIEVLKAPHIGEDGETACGLSMT